MGNGGWLTPLSLVAGSLCAQLFTSLPPPWLICGTALFALPLLISGRTRWLAIALLSCCWVLLHFQFRLADRLGPELAGSILTVSGVISDLPKDRGDYTSFEFRPVDAGSSTPLPGKLLVHWYRDRPALAAGQAWRLELKLKPPWGAVNFQGSDRERWLFARGIGGLGTVRGGHRLPSPGRSGFQLERLRGQVNVRIAERLGDGRPAAVVQALTTAERTGLTADDRRLLAATGTSHLLAISGLHVGLAAAGGFWLTRLLLGLLPAARRGVLLFVAAIAGGLICAYAYAALAGFGIPTLRAALMVTIALAAISLSRLIHPLRALLLAAALALLVNPFAALGAGFWFSFTAVSVLLCLFAPRTGSLRWWQTMLLAQSGIMIALLPLSVSWFHLFSPAGFLANLVAIPWVSFLVVPPVLGGVTALALSDQFAGLLWSLAGFSISALFLCLEFIGNLQGPLSAVAAPDGVTVVLAVLGGFLLLLPRGLPMRWLGLFLLAPMVLPVSPHGKRGDLELEVLDAGQGTAAIVRSGEHSLLYDSGPGDGRDRNIVDGIVAPALARLGRGAPNRVVISHGDLDHAGGLKALQRRYPGARFLANLPGARGAENICRNHMYWEWPGVRFRVLHPSSGLPYRGNDSSCVISIGNGRESLLLLSGDISAEVENRLLTAGLEPHRLLLVPHHGSATSSSMPFVRQLGAQAAIATAGLGNRFGFPREEVRLRYLGQGARFWSTAGCGAIRIVIRADGTLQASSARRVRNRLWRWPAAPNCP